MGHLTGLPVEERDEATVGACLAGRAAGAHIFRVHNVKALAGALNVFDEVSLASLANTETELRA